MPKLYYIHISSRSFKQVAALNGQQIITAAHPGFIVTRSTSKETRNTPQPPKEEFTMKFGKIICTALIALCASSAAMAQNWTGAYIGLNAGRAWARSDVNTVTSYTSTGYLTSAEVAVINGAGSGRVKLSGFTGGLTLGYNWHHGHGWNYGHSFFGLEGDYNHFSADDSRTLTFADPCCAGASYTLRQNLHVGHLATFRARGGWASPHWLIYATAGGAFTKVVYSEVFTDTLGNAYEASRLSHSYRIPDGAKVGFVWGAGAEAQWAKHWSIKAEWLRSRFPRVSGPGGTLSTTIGGVTTNWNDPFTHSANLKVDMARVGLNYRF